MTETISNVSALDSQPITSDSALALLRERLMGMTPERKTTNAKRYIGGTRAAQRAYMADRPHIGYTEHRYSMGNNTIYSANPANRHASHYVPGPIDGLRIGVSYAIVPGAIYQFAGSLWHVLSVRGSRSQYVQIKRVMPHYATELPESMYYGRAQWVFAHRLVGMKYDSILACFIAAKLEAKENELIREYREKLNKAQNDVDLLSRNTVTRALVHADSNGYCNETVIALTSAGHRMPDAQVTVSVQMSVTLSLDGADDYYAFRAMAGACNGDWDKLTGYQFPDTEYGFNLNNRIEDAINNGNYCLNDTDTIESVDMTWQSPAIRPVA